VPIRNYSLTPAADVWCTNCVSKNKTLHVLSLITRVVNSRKFISQEGNKFPGTRSGLDSMGTGKVMSHNFASCEPIYKILSSEDSQWNILFAVTKTPTSPGMCRCTTLWKLRIHKCWDDVDLLAGINAEDYVALLEITDSLFTDSVLCLYSHIYAVSQKWPNFATVAQNYRDQFWSYVAQIFRRCRIELFQFSCRFAFYQLFLFQTGHWKYRVTLPVNMSTVQNFLNFTSSLLMLFFVQHLSRNSVITAECCNFYIHTDFWSKFCLLYSMPHLLYTAS